MVYTCITSSIWKCIYIFPCICTCYICSCKVITPASQPSIKMCTGSTRYSVHGTWYSLTLLVVVTAGVLTCTAPCLLTSVLFFFSLTACCCSNYRQRALTSILDHLVPGSWCQVTTYNRKLEYQVWYQVQANLYKPTFPHYTYLYFHICIYVSLFNR